MTCEGTKGGETRLEPHTHPPLDPGLPHLGVPADGAAA